MDRLAATFAVARVYANVVGGPGLEIVHGERRNFARLVGDGRARFSGRAAGAWLPVHLYRELLRQTAVEALCALYVQRVRRLVQKGAIVRRVWVTWRK